MFDDTKPIYRQIAERIETDVLTGTLGPDDKVMSTNEYSAFYRINPATVGKAFQQLVDRGVLYKQRGIGMFVDPGAKDLLRNEHRRHFVDNMVVPLVAEAMAIGLSLDEVIEAIQEIAKEEVS